MKWTYLRGGPGRPRVMETIQDFVLRIARENPRWGYTRIQGALSNLGHKVARGTVANILKREGIEPAPTRGERTPWSVFLKAHWRSLVAADFLTVEVWKLRRLMTYYVLFFIELPTRAVRIAGITTSPAKGWMLQVARNACDVDDGVLSEGRKLLIDQDAKYSGDWRTFVKQQGVEVIRLPPKSPNLNAYAERFVRSIKDECLNRMIFIGEAALRRVIGEFMAHYHAERNHQGLGNRLHQRRTALRSSGWPGGTTSPARWDAELLSLRSRVRSACPGERNLGEFWAKLEPGADRTGRSPRRKEPLNQWLTLAAVSRNGGGGGNRTRVREHYAVRTTCLARSFGSRLAPAGRQADARPAASTDPPGQAARPGGEAGVNGAAPAEQAWLAPPSLSGPSPPAG